MTKKPEYQQYLHPQESSAKNPENILRNTAREFWDDRNKDYDGNYLDSAENDLRLLEERQGQIRELELQELELQEMQKKLNRKGEPTEAGRSEAERDSYRRAMEDRKDMLMAELEEDRRRQEALGNQRIKSADKSFGREGNNVGPSVNHNYAYMPKGGHRNYGEPGPLSDAGDKSFAKEFERSVPRDKYGNSSNYYKEIEKYHNHTPLTQMNGGDQNNNIRGINNIYNKMDYKNTTGNP